MKDHATHTYKSTGAWKMLRALGLLVLVTFGLLFQANAQSDNGRIVGNVTDPTGAVVPGATITVTNVDNGNVLNATSNANGEFNVFAVPRGNYTAKITAPGFQSQSQTFTITVTQVQTLMFHLKPGAVATTVQVTGAAPLVNTTNSTLGETIQGKQMYELPLNGLNFTNLALLTPGVTQGSYANPNSGVAGNAETFRYNDSGDASLSVNGLPPTADNYILDGVDNNDDLMNTVIFFPPIYATQEFKVDTSVAPAQYGRAGGAIVVSSIKSGTNEYHGNLFEYYRSDQFNANPYYIFPGESAQKNPLDNRNQFGFDAGGPIIKNKLFAFGDYQAWREHSPVGGGLVTVPYRVPGTALQDMTQGDLSVLTTSAFNNSNQTGWNGSQVCGIAQDSRLIYDPLTCKPFPGNIIPGDRLNYAAQNYLKAFPYPSIPNEVFQNYETFEQEITNYNDFDVRLDWNATPKDAVFFRYSYDNAVQEKTSEFQNLPAGFGTGSSYNHARGYDLGYTRIFTSNAVNELHLNYNRDDYGYQPPMYGDPVSANLGIVNANRNLETSGGALIGGYGYELEYSGDYGLYAVPQNNIEATDTFDWERGNNSFKFGGTFIRRQMEYFRPIAGKGFFNISGNGQDFTGYEVSDLLASFNDNYSIGAQNGFFSNLSQENAIFAQDDWRVSPRLTLNMGIRWDDITWPVESHNRQASFDINTGQVLLAGQNGVSRSIVNQYYGYFSPRIGFAYDLRGDGKSVIRGGYGIYYFPTYGGISNQLGQQPPFGGSVDYQARLGYCVALTGQTPTVGTNGLNSCQVNAYTPNATTGIVTPLPLPGFPNFNPAQPPSGLSTLAVDRNNRQSDIQEWNLQLEQQIAAKDVVDIAYVGNKVAHLPNYYNYTLWQFGQQGGSPLGSGQRNFPNLGTITYEVYNGAANYNGLQLQYNHHEKNLMTTAAYAWSHTLDDECGTLCLYYDPQASYGNSGQDQRNVFSFSTVYTLPFGRGQMFAGNVSHMMDWLIGGWQTNLIALFQSGQPFDLSDGVTYSGNEPDQVAPIKYPKSIRGYWFDPKSFSYANIPQYDNTATGATVFTRPGTARRDQLFGPGTRIINLGLEKDVHVTDRYNVALRGDAFNVLNTPQFTNPGSDLNGGNFAKVQSVTYQSNRQLQLSARIDF
ncbi:MAG: carboxypeptidase regulatory-like domain-containing protein [Acidobacteriaceae bacterium]